MEFTLKPSETPGDRPPTMTCPKCGFEQPESPECVKCGVVIARYKPSPAPTPAYTPPPPEKSKAQEAIDRLKAITPPPAGPSLFSRLFHLAKWAVVLGCLAALFLIFRTAPRPSVAVDPEGPRKVADKLRAAEEAAGQGQSLTLELTEAELNAWLRSHLASGAGQVGASSTPAPAEVQSSMKDLTLRLVGDRVQAYTVYPLYGKDVSLQLTGKLFVKDGRIRLDATEGMIGTLPLPKAALGSVTASLFDAPTNREKFVLPPHVADVRVINGALVISYRGLTPP